jgi:hypothetical protein
MLTPAVAAAAAATTGNTDTKSGSVPAVVPASASGPSSGGDLKLLTPALVSTLRLLQSHLFYFNRARTVGMGPQLTDDEIRRLWQLLFVRIPNVFDFEGPTDTDFKLPKPFRAKRDPKTGRLFFVHGKTSVCRFCLCLVYMRASCNDTFYMCIAMDRSSSTAGGLGRKT